MNQPSSRDQQLQLSTRLRRRTGETRRTASWPTPLICRVRSMDTLQNRSDWIQRGVKGIFNLDGSKVIYIYMNLIIYAHINKYIYIYTHICIYIYIYMHTHTHMHSNLETKLGKPGFSFLSFSEKIIGEATIFFQNLLTKMVNIKKKR